MRRLFLFAIGGTGARVVRSLTMMLASGIDGLDSSTEIVPIIIDYDLSNGDKTRAIKALRKYAGIQNFLYPRTDSSGTPVNYADHFFMTRLTPLSQTGIANPEGLKDYELNFGPAGSEKKFSEYLRLSDMAKKPNERLTHDLMYALYDSSPTDSRDAELELDMNKGFKGNPNIGTVVFHDLPKTREFERFEATFDATQGDAVFIVSSIFGGTGASGLPEIVNAIRKNKRATFKDAVIGAAFVLPYFDLQGFNPQNGDTGAIDPGSFNPKTKAALAYYASQNGLNQKINAIYYIGDENRDAYEYNEGEDRQKNAAHVVEFVAATGIIDFMQFQRQQEIADARKAYEFSVKDARIKTGIQLPDFHQSTHTLVLDNLSSFAIAMKYYRDVVCGDRDKVSSDTAFYGRFNLSDKLGKGFYAQLDDFLEAHSLLPEKDRWGFYPWLEELHKHKHNLFLYCMSKDKEMPDVLTYKTIPNSVIKGRPISDSTLKGELNDYSKKLTEFTELSFMKILRDMAKTKYNHVK